MKGNEMLKFSKNFILLINASNFDDPRDQTSISFGCGLWDLENLK